jgi:acetylornithine/succinyldiaminopimelate/putrescine aminotransferase
VLKKTITYETYNGETVTEDFYFNLTKAELIELEVSEDQGFAESLQEIVKSNSGRQIIDAFKKIVLISYGQKSEDGKRFIKSEEMKTEFSQTQAYSEVFMELATDAGAAAAFVNAVIPQGLASAVEEAQKTVALAENGVLAPPPEDNMMAALTDEQLASMSNEELVAHYRATHPE